MTVRNTENKGKAISHVQDKGIIAHMVKNKAFEKVWRN